MKTVSALKHVVAPALAAGVLVTAFAAPAVAQEPPGSTVVRSSGTVSLNARSGVSNYVTVSSASGRLIVEDQSGITAGPGCTRLSSTAAACGATATATRLAFSLGNWSDVLSVGVAVSSSVNAGSGTDVITTGGGNDSVNASDGVGGNDWVTCDGGSSDSAFADPGDSVSRDCERRFPLS
ncbi:hypothetical protein STRCI_002628 [Streptomyces cinnabarinus]|uniref:Uncharacterized protein n=1 Tax=Streptomyces cinnabarinus TaxID=67287 RepID=A0ABY7KET6_9ACTN|nr:hypothetical protein [Streptomyces cinnabarinus]WAZ21454.1 hypothetical protein STRCI_002628 [Streptomyces cinnabarinus]